MDANEGCDIEAMDALISILEQSASVAERIMGDRISFIPASSRGHMEGPHFERDTRQIDL